MCRDCRTFSHLSCGKYEYKGEAILPKSFCTDFLTKKTKKNEGELPQYHVRDSHPAIVTSELWDLVQIEIARRKALGKHYSGGGAFASRVVCGECGGFYGPKVWHSTDPYRTVIWRCNGKYATSESERGPCRCPHIREDELIRRFMLMMCKVLARKSVVLAACQEAINSLMIWDETELERLRHQADGLAGKVRNLIVIKAHAYGEQDVFEQDYKKFVGQHERLVSRIEKAEAEKKDREDRARKIELYMGLLERQDERVEFDSALFALFVDKVIVSGTKRDIQLRFNLADGSEWEV